MSQSLPRASTARSPSSIRSISRSIPTAPAAACISPARRSRLLCVVAAIVTRNPWWLLAALLCGYGFAWIGHFAFEKNQPASFKQPLYSLMGDWKMFWQIVTGKIAL